MDIASIFAPAPFAPAANQQHGFAPATTPARIIVRRFSAYGPCLTKGEFVRQTARFVVFTECFFAILCAHIRHGGTWAYYAPGFDRIQMPTFEAFRSGRRLLRDAGPRGHALDRARQPVSPRPSSRREN